MNTRMNIRDIFCKSVIVMLLIVLQASESSAAQEARIQTTGGAPGIDTATIERLTGVKGKFNEKESVFKVSVPRTDLQVTVANVRMAPPLGLTSWAAFTSTGDHVMVMGDIVLLEDQVNPVMSVALEKGLEVTALHNHFFWDSPKVMFMHIGGQGDEEILAAAVGKVFTKSRETSGGAGDIPRAHIDPAKTLLDPKRIEGIIGTKGEMSDGIYKITIGRTTKVDGHLIGNAMGINTWAAFAGSDEQAIVDGDFVVFENELQAVLKALRRGGIDIVAIHHHITEESPRVVFLHYWGVGTTTDLAKALKSALATTRSNSP